MGPGLSFCLRILRPSKSPPSSNNLFDENNRRGGILPELHGRPILSLPHDHQRWLLAGVLASPRLKHRPPEADIGDGLPNPNQPPDRQGARGREAGSCGGRENQTAGGAAADRVGATGAGEAKEGVGEEGGGGATQGEGARGG